MKELLGEDKEYILSAIKGKVPIEFGNSLHCFHEVYAVQGLVYKIEGAYGQDSLDVYLMEPYNEI